MKKKKLLLCILSKFAKPSFAPFWKTLYNEVPRWKETETLNLYLQLEELSPCDKKISFVK